MESLKLSLHSIDGKVKFSATSRDNSQITIDYFPPIGSGEGYTSLELLMAAYGSCVSPTILTILRYKMGKTIIGISLQMEGKVRDEHPKALESISTTLQIKAEDLVKQEVMQALEIAENGLCPVWSMIKGSVTADFIVEIIQ